MINNKVKRIISSLLMLAMMIGVFPFSMMDSYAAGNTKTMTIKFEEQLEGQSRSKTVTIPHLKSIESVKTNTGNVSYNKSGDKVIVYVSGGNPSKSVNNPKKYSKQVTDYSTSSNNSFRDTKIYNKNRYSGTLRKDGSSRVISGNYTPGDSKTVTDTRSSQGSDTTPSSVPYDSGGYSGTLKKTDTTTNRVQTGGSPADSKFVTAQTSANYDDGVYSGALEKYVYSGTYTPAHSKTVVETVGPQSSSSFPSTRIYSSGGYSGTLEKFGDVTSSITTEWVEVSHHKGCYEHMWGDEENISGEYPNRTKVVRYYDCYVGGDFPWRYDIYRYKEKPITKYSQQYSGTVTKPAVDTRVYRYKGTVYKPDTRTYRTDYTATYSGTVTKPAVDTRTWQQDYSGTVYKAGIDNYYKYTVTIEYIDNSAPVLSISTGNSIKYINNNGSFTLSGTVTDTDVNQKVTVSATIGGKTKLQTFDTPIDNKEWSLTWSGNELAEGRYSNITVTAKDTEGGSNSKTYSGTLVVDKSGPIITFSPNGNSNPKKSQSTTVNVSDSPAGVKEKKYSWSKLETSPSSWSSTYSDKSGGDGNWYLHVKATDNAGNISNSVSKAFNLDNTPPTLKVISDINTWRPAPMPIKVQAKDGNAGVSKIRQVGASWTTGDTVSIEVDKNGTYYFEAIDKAGNTGELKVEITKIDDIPPKPFKFRVKNIQENYAELEIKEAKDEQSGLHKTPYKFSKDGGSTWTNWQTGTTHKFDNLSYNKTYNFEAQVRDKAKNTRTESVKIATLTNDIKLNKAEKPEGYNEVKLTIDLNGNPSDTQTLITRQNMITKETVVIKDWSTNRNCTDRVPTFVPGYRYTAYARNRNGVVGNPASTEVKDKEEPLSNLKGFGTDKYLWYKDKVNYKKDTGKDIDEGYKGKNTLFIIGKNSGYVNLEVDTVATERLGYVWKCDGEVLVDDFEDKRLGDVRYRIPLPIKQSDKEIYTLELETIIKQGEQEERITLPTETFIIYHIPKWSSMVNWASKGEGESLKITQTNKNVEEIPGTIEGKLNPVMKDAIKEGMIINKQSSKPGDTISLPEGIDSFEICKYFNNGTYTEVVKAGKVSIKTNIKQGVTEHNPEDGDWKIEGEVVTEEGKFNIPNEIDQLMQEGYKIEMVVVPNYSSNETENYKKWQDLMNQGNKQYFENEDLKSFKANPPLNAEIGFKVTRLIPTYKFETLNLQPLGFSKGTNTLESYGNANIQYDDKMLYNRITNKAEMHNKPVYNKVNDEWISELYYRVEEGERQLVLVTREGYTIFDVNTLKPLQEKTFPNAGSIIINNKLYLGTSTGLFEYKLKDEPAQTKYTEKVNHLATNGSHIFVAKDSGLDILETDLDVYQYIANEDIHPEISQIQSLHTSQGTVYIGKDKNGNKFLPIER